MKNVLFVCIGNCCRSQIAEGFARHSGSDVINAASAGFRPTPVVSPDTIATMAEIGIDISGYFSKEIDFRHLDSYDIVVNISGYDLPALQHALVAEWDVRDPFYEEAAVFREVRLDIQQRVESLIEDIRRNGTITEGVASYKPKPGLWQRLTKRGEPSL